MLVDLWNNSTQDPVLKINSFTQNGYNIYASKKKSKIKKHAVYLNIKSIIRSNSLLHIHVL